MVITFHTLFRLGLGLLATLALIEWITLQQVTFPLLIWLSLVAGAVLCWLIQFQAQSLALLRQAHLSFQPARAARFRLRLLAFQFGENRSFLAVVALLAVGSSLLVHASMQWLGNGRFPWPVLLRLSIMWAVFLFAAAWAGRPREEDQGPALARVVDEDLVPGRR